MQNLLTPDEQNKKIQNAVVEALKTTFPIQNNGKTLIVQNIQVNDNLDPFDFPLQKELKLSRKSWHIPVTGDISIIDDATGKPISTVKNIKLANLPKITNRFSVIIDGNEYQTVNQLRRKPGVYSRTKKNGELEAEFNLSKGRNFKMELDPVAQLFYVILDNRKYKLWTILNTLGVLDSEISALWGKELLTLNKQSALNSEVSDLENLHKKLVNKKGQFDMATIRKDLVAYFNSTEVDKDTTLLTLGESFTSVSGRTMLLASKKLLDITKGLIEQDDRDSLIYKRLYSPEDLVLAYFEKQAPTITAKLKRTLGLKDSVREIISPNTFSSPIEKFFTTGDLSSTPPQTNPITIVSEWRKTTPMGTGGIKSSHAITMDTRDVQPTHLGFLDPLASPDGGKVGVTVGLTSEVIKQGNDMATPVIDKNDTISYLNPTEFFSKKIGFPDQFIRKNGKIVNRYPEVTVMYKGETIQVAPSEVDFYLRSAKSMFSLQQNLVPFGQNVQGNRASMSSRYMTQALNLKEREQPLIQNFRNSNETYEQTVGEFLNPYSPVKGTVSKITDDYIYIAPEKGGTDVKIGLYKNFPLNQDGFLNSEVLVKEGDKVDPATVLTQNNYTVGNTLALGKNLNVAYMSYKGYNFEDGIVITDSASKKLTHSMIHRESIFYNPKISILNKNKFNAWFPDLISPENFKKLDKDGIIKVGETVNSGDVIAAFLVEKQMEDIDQALKKLDKLTFNNYSKNVTEWHDEDSGVVTEVRRNGRNIDIYIKADHPLKVGDKLCVDEQTEILTDHGWKTVSSITGGERFCTLNPDTKVIEYQEATEFNIYDHNGPLYYISNSSIDQAVTLNHRMYVKARDKEDYAFITASTLKGKRASYLKTGKWAGKTVKVPSCFNNVSTENYIKFMAWFLSEGSVIKNYKGYLIDIAQSLEINPDKYNEIFELVKNLGVTPLKLQGRIRFNSKAIYNYLAQFGKSFEKYVPDNIKNGNVNNIRLFLETYVKGDGSIGKTGQSTITTNSTKMRDDLMELALKAGYAANYKKSMSAGDKITIKNKNTQANHDIFVVRLYTKRTFSTVNHSHVKTQNAQIEEIKDYVGKVGCPSTPNGIIYIRRNGKTSWTGNSNRYGGKGIVTHILPDSEAPRTKDGRVMEILLSAEGVPGRMNIGQILETAASKIAEKTGKPYIVNNFENPDENMSKKVFDEMKALGLEPDEMLIDGATGQEIKTPIFTGKQYIMKLRHIINKKMSAHDYGAYDVNEQPVGEGAQKIGQMETYAYLAHNARNLLRDATTVKSQKNEEYWKNVQLGLPPTRPDRNFIFDKMVTYLKGASVNVTKEGNTLKILPLTDEDTLKLSKGEITDPGAMLVGKNLATRKNGLFDATITGGPKGENWAHIKLYDKIPNPLYEDAIIKVLDLNENRYENILNGKEQINGLTGMEAIVTQLKSLDIPKELEAAKKALNNAPPTAVNKLNTRVKYLQTLSSNNLTADKAYTIEYIPIIPPRFRPIYPLPSGDLMVNDINKHYRDVGIINQGLKAVSKDLVPEEKYRADRALYNSVAAMQGLIEPINYSKEKYKGFIAELGTTKTGLIHGAAWAKRQDLSARSTITVDPSLGLDQIGVPFEIAYKVYKPYVIRDMKEMGLKATEALKNYQEETDLAKNALQNVMANRPVILNRAPSLHQHSVQAFTPILSSGKDIKLNPLINKGFNSDVDGDLQINNVIIYIENEYFGNQPLDIVKNNAYLCNSDERYLSYRQLTKTYKDTKKMTARFNVTLPAKKGNFYITNLADFPHLKEEKLGTKGHIDFYKVPEGIKVIALDEKTGKLILTDVGGFSVHKDREVWTVDLLNGRQIITDDDPRAVYGIGKESLDLKRFTPSEAIGVMVPVAKELSNIKNMGFPITEIKINPKTEESRLKSTAKLTKKLGYLLGALVGDGWYDTYTSSAGSLLYKSVNFAGIQKEVVAAYKDSLLEVFLEAPHIGYKESLDSYGKSEKWIVNSSEFGQFVAPLIGKLAKNKHLPPFWFNAPRDFKIGLMSGLFDTDGCITLNKSAGMTRLSASFSSISLRLLQEIQQMLLTLDIRSKISFSKKTSSDNDFWSLAISVVDLQKIKDELIIAHVGNKKALMEVTPDATATASIRTDLVPISQDILKALIKRLGAKRIASKEVKSFYSTLKQAEPKGYVSRTAALKCIAFAKENNVELPEQWLKIVSNTAVTWTPVIEVTNTGKKETGYDLTVPGYETFMNVDGIVLSNTMSLMVPASDEAVLESYKMMPSKILYKHGDNSLMPELAKDYIYGLYELSKINGTSAKTFKTVEEAKKGVDWTTVVSINGKKTTVGQYLINEPLPEKYRDYTRELSSKVAQGLLREIGAKESSDIFSKVINTWKDLGSTYSYMHGHTISLNDFIKPKDFRDNLIKTEMPKINKLKGEARINALNDLTQKVQSAQANEIKGTNLAKMLDSGSFTKADSIRQIYSMPGVLTDISGKPLDRPVLKSYGEGIDTASYFNALYAVRKGTVDRAVNTQDSGALNKSLLSVGRRLLVTQEDCQTLEGLEISVDDKNVMDRCSAVTIPGVVKRNEIVTGTVVSLARQKNIRNLLVRSPLTCKTVEGVCQKCYGLLPNGQLAPIGTNVGILENQAISERTTQLTMQCTANGFIIGKDGKTFTTLNQEATQYHAPEDTMVGVRLESGDLMVVQANHPMWVNNGAEEIEKLTRHLIPNTDHLINATKEIRELFYSVEEKTDVLVGDPVNVKSNIILGMIAAQGRIKYSTERILFSHGNNGNVKKLVIENNVNPTCSIKEHDVEMGFWIRQIKKLKEFLSIHDLHRFVKTDWSKWTEKSLCEFVGGALSIHTKNTGTELILEHTSFTFLNQLRTMLAVLDIPSSLDVITDKLYEFNQIYKITIPLCQNLQKIAKYNAILLDLTASDFAKMPDLQANINSFTKVLSVTTIPIQSDIEIVYDTKRENKKYISGTTVNHNTFHCWEGGSTVFTEEGDPRSIADLERTEYSGKVLDRDGKFVAVKKIWKHLPQDDMYIIKTKNRHILLLQGNHPVMLNGVPVEARDIKKDDVLDFQPIKYAHGEKSWPYSISPRQFTWVMCRFAFTGRNSEDSFAFKEHDRYAFLNLNCAFKEGKNRGFYFKDSAELKQITEDLKQVKFSRFPDFIFRLKKEHLKALLGAFIDINFNIRKKSDKGLYIGVGQLPLDLLQQLTELCLIANIDFDVEFVGSEPKGLFGLKIYSTQKTLKNLKGYSNLLEKTKEVATVLKCRQRLSSNYLKSPGKVVIARKSLYLPNFVYDIETESGTLVVNNLWAHNSGGSALAGGGIQAGFPRVEQLFKVPETLANKALISEISGTVKSISKNEIGGYTIQIDNEAYQTYPGLEPKVKIGDKVDEGDVLSTGVIKPQELSQRKSHLAAQRYMVDELDKVFQNKFYKKTFETAVRGISDNALIIKAPEDSGFIKGDKSTISFLTELNAQRKSQGLDLVEFKPYFKSIDTLNTDSDDFMTRITTNRVKAALMSGAPKGLISKIKGKDPIPAYIYGEDFGVMNPDKGEFY